MLDTCRLASYVPKGKEKQAMKQQKAMLIALNLFNRHSDGTGNEERPLRGTNPNRPDGGRCLHSLRT